MFKPISYFKIHLLSGVSRGRPTQPENRRTICFSRSVELHEKVIGAFIGK
ncbi:hypothetical protein CA284_21230 (plasmid) [Enterobacter mori]|nr:hypothetical protein CA284_21230 [Enterobacter mori]